MLCCARSRLSSPNQVTPQCTRKALLVEGHGILLDMRCSKTMVLQDMVALEKVVVGKVVTMTCAHRGTEVHPLVEVKLELEGVYICVEAALAEELPSMRN